MSQVEFLGITTCLTIIFKRLVKIKSILNKFETRLFALPLNSFPVKQPNINIYTTALTGTSIIDKDDIRADAG